MAIRFLERYLEQQLREAGRDDLFEAGTITFTDDGGTIYAHLMPRPGWPGKAQGRAFVLAWEDYVPEGSDSMYCYRWLVKEAKISLRDNIGDVIRWLEGK
jgi:hypothetical protein